MVVPAVTVSPASGASASSLVTRACAAGVVTPAALEFSSVSGCCSAYVVSALPVSCPIGSVVSRSALRTASWPAM